MHIIVIIRIRASPTLGYKIEVIMIYKRVTQYQYHPHPRPHTAHRVQTARRNETNRAGRAPGASTSRRSTTSLLNNPQPTSQAQKHSESAITRRIHNKKEGTNTQTKAAATTKGMSLEQGHTVFLLLFVFSCRVVRRMTIGYTWETYLPHPWHIRRTRLGLCKIFVCFKAFVHESIVRIVPPSTVLRIAHAIAVLLHDRCAMQDPPPTPLVYAIYHTKLGLAISCKGQHTARRGTHRHVTH